MVADKKTATFVLELQTIGDTGPKTQTYTFYVPPEQIEHTSPARLTVYQSVDGSTHIDHMGEGLASIAISGSTGWTFGSNFSHPFAYHSYMLLRKIVEDYYIYCKQGKAERETLTLTVDMPDANGFGQWRVAVRNMTLRRHASQPLLFQYGIQFVCISENMTSFDYNKQLQSLKRQVEATETSGDSSSMSLPSSMSGAPSSTERNISSAEINFSKLTNPLQYDGPVEDLKIDRWQNERWRAASTAHVQTAIPQTTNKIEVPVGRISSVNQQTGGITGLEYGPTLNLSRKLVYDPSTSATIAATQKQAKLDYEYSNNGQLDRYEIYGYTKEEIANALLGDKATADEKESFYRCNKDLTDSYNEKVKVLREEKRKQNMDQMLKI
jgi:hypothetical protein